MILWPKSRVLMANQCLAMRIAIAPQQQLSLSEKCILFLVIQELFLTLHLNQTHFSSYLSCKIKTGGKKKCICRSFQVQQNLLAPFHFYCFKCFTTKANLQTQIPMNLCLVCSFKYIFFSLHMIH